MKKLIAVLLLLSVYSSLHAQGEKYTNAEFGWTIQLPAGFENVDQATLDKLQDRGAEAIGDAYNADFSSAVNSNKTLLVIKKGDTNYLQVGRQPFDPAVDGSYEDKTKLIVEMMEKTFKQQMPGTKIDTKITKETISGIEFSLIKMEIHISSTATFHALMYSRLFGKKDFSVNIMYMDKEAGKAMLDAFKKSVFK